MTVSSPTFQRLQTGIKAADDSRVRIPINLMMEYLSGDLVTQINTHFGEVSQSISVAIQALKGTANTWTEPQTISDNATGLVFVVENTAAGDGTGTIVVLRSAAANTANNVIAQLQFRADDSSAADTTYGNIFCQILDPTDTSEDGRIVIRTLRAGANSDWRVQSGTLYHSGQTAPSNEGEVAAAAYKVGANQVVAARVTGYGDPFGAISRATISVTTVTTAALAQFVAAMYTDLKAHGLLGN